MTNEAVALFYFMRHVFIIIRIGRWIVLCIVNA